MPHGPLLGIIERMNDEGAAAGGDTFVVIAAYNEAVVIRDVLRELTIVYPNVVVVDDGSRDGTFDAARQAAPFVLRHAVNCGQGAALQTGIDFALSRGLIFDTLRRERGVLQSDRGIVSLPLHALETPLNPPLLRGEGLGRGR